MEEQSNMQRGVIMASEGELAAVVMLNALFSAHGISIFFAKNSAVMDLVNQCQVKSSFEFTSTKCVCAHSRTHVWVGIEKTSYIFF